MKITSKHKTILVNLSFMDHMLFKKEYLKKPSKELDIKVRRILALIKAGYIKTDVCPNNNPDKQDYTYIGLSATGYGLIDSFSH